MGTTNTTSRTDLLRLAPSGARPVPLAIRPDSFPRALFLAEVLGRGAAHVVQDRFRGLTTPARISELAETVILVRADPDAQEVEAFVRLAGGELVLIDTGYAEVRLEVAAHSRERASAAAAMLRAALEAAPTPRTQVPVSFWMRGEEGGQVRHRNIDAQSFDEIAGNYPAPLRTALERLLATRAPDRGRLILWRGEPGTGKSHALRTLLRAWAPWCSALFIMDPDELLERGGAYMLDVLTWDGDGDNDDRWRLLILEDAGELIAADARSVTGQALSRLLNVADGILGEGTHTLLLITTNEPLKRLHPATRRPGRCLADIEFATLSTTEANAWLADRGHERRVDRPTTLAELYGYADAAPLAGKPAPAPAGFGFARALEDPARR